MTKLNLDLAVDPRLAAMAWLRLPEESLQLPSAVKENSFELSHSELGRSISKLIERPFEFSSRMSLRERLPDWCAMHGVSSGCIDPKDW